MTNQRESLINIIEQELRKTAPLFGVHPRYHHRPKVVGDAHPVECDRGIAEPLVGKHRNGAAGDGVFAFRGEGAAT